jgi:hypothetical protein
MATWVNQIVYEHDGYTGLADVLVLSDFAWEDVDARLFVRHRLSPREGRCNLVTWRAFTIPQYIELVKNPDGG